ncbi:MAG TPA: hypothetical protein VL361_00545 [Candidatus Limnocylindrales bacterium]|nr:hypothetical protein [Candidatus Limnocylindrales bacterium]
MFRLNVPRFWRQLKLLAQFGALQAAAQFIAALSGLFLVRILDKSEFAAYAIATSLFTTLNVLTDSGIGTGLNAVGGRIWRDSGAMSRLVRTALAFRVRLLLLAVPLGFGFSLVLFRQNEISWTRSMMLMLAVLSGLWGMIHTSTYAISLRLSGRYLEVQRLELLASLLRLALLSCLFLVCINATLAVLTAVLTISLQAACLRQKALLVLYPNAPLDAGYRGELGRFIKGLWFSTAFFAFQGQLTIWLIALFGTRDRIAEIGALGRLSVIFAFISSLINGIATPTFARCDSTDRLRRLFSTMLLGYLLFAIALLAAAFGFPHEILSLLGARYTGLAAELPLMFGISILWGLTGIFYALASARGWIWRAWASPLATLGLQVVLLRTFDLSKVRGVLLFGLLSALPTLCSVAYMAIRGLTSSEMRRPE